MKKILFAASAALALLCSFPARAQFELKGVLTDTTCTGTGGGAQAQETGCVVMNLSAQTGSVSAQVTSNADTLQFEVSNDSSTWVSANAYPLPSGPAVTSTTTTGIWQVDTGGAKRFRVRASAGAAATVYLSQSFDPALGNAGVQSVTGTGTAGTAAAGIVTVQGIDVSGAAPTGNPVLMGAYDTANVQRIQSDTSGRLKVVGAAATGAAVSGNPVLTAGLGFNGTARPPRWCDKMIAFTTLSTTATVQQIALVAGQTIYVCGWYALASTAVAAVNLKWVTGTGSNCATGTADVTPLIFTTPTSAPTLANWTQSPFTTGAIPFSASASALCITQSGTANATTLSGVIWYTQN